jgi:hypothetical protein
MNKTKSVLSEKAKKFCLEYVAGEDAGNGTQSYMNAYQNVKRGSAACLSQMLLKKPLIQMEIVRLKQKAGISEDWVLAKLKEGAEANIVTVFRGRGLVTGVPDYGIRHQYINTAAKILKMFPSVKSDHRTINIDVQLEKLSPVEISNLLRGIIKPNAKQPRKNNLLTEGQTQSGGSNS